MVNYVEYISIESGIRFGKATIKGTRISVYDVLGWLASGMDTQQILTDYPELNKEQIQACLSYAAAKEHNIRVAS